MIFPPAGKAGNKYRSNSSNSSVGQQMETLRETRLRVYIEAAETVRTCWGILVKVSGVW